VSFDSPKWEESFAHESILHWSESMFEGVLDEMSDFQVNLDDSINEELLKDLNEFDET